MYLTSISCDAGTEALFGSASSCVPNPLPFFFSLLLQDNVSLGFDFY